MTTLTLDTYTGYNKVCSHTFSHIVLFFIGTCSHKLSLILNIGLQGTTPIRALLGWMTFKRTNWLRPSKRGLGQMMGLWATGYELGTRSNKDRNLGSWEGGQKRMKTKMMIKETMIWNENTRLMCQWLVLNPLRGIKEVTSIYTCLWDLHVVLCIDPFSCRSFWKLLKTLRTWNR